MARQLSSMTGYGRGSTSLGALRCTVEARSVNGRFLEVRTKLPRAFLALEGRIRERVAKSITRGIFDLNLTMQPEQSGAADLIDEPLALAYAKGIELLASKGKIEAEVSAMELLCLPGVLIGEEGIARFDSEEAWPLLQKAIDEAVGALLQMRAEEGKRLQVALSRELDAFSGFLGSVREIRGKVNARYMEKIKARFAELREKLHVNMDETRAHQEMIFYVDRSDVTEELDRLQSHLAEARGLLLEGNGAIGKRLDFLLQEMGRETNTIGAKSDVLEVTKLVIGMKTSLERLREQVQNIE